jgi:golgi phosphoprotein 3
MLTLYDELFLLSISDAKGEVVGSVASYLPYGLAGAVLAELALLGKVQAERRRLSVVDSTPAGDELLDESLALIALSDRPRTLTHWISALGARKMQKRIAKGLVTKNVLRVERKRILWVIPYDAHPQQDASAKYWIKGKLRTVVLAGGEADPHTVALLSLLRACHLLDLVFTKDERKAAADKINELVNGELLGEAVAQTLAELDGAAVAVMAAVNAAVTA